MTRTALLLVVALLAATPARAASVAIRSCHDGDTCWSTSGERIRLACIDAPERGEAGDRAATSAIRQMVEGRQVGIRRITRDRYGRTIGELYVDGNNVGRELVNQGHAWIYGRYAYQCPWAK